MMCAAPAFHSTQHWFLLVVVLGFIGTLYFTLHNLAIDTYVKNLAVNFTQVVSILFSWLYIIFIYIYKIGQLTHISTHFVTISFKYVSFAGVLVHGHHYISLFYWIHCNVSGFRSYS